MEEVLDRTMQTWDMKCRVIRERAAQEGKKIWRHYELLEAIKNTMADLEALGVMGLDTTEEKTRVQVEGWELARDLSRD